MKKTATTTVKKMKTLGRNAKDMIKTATRRNKFELPDAFNDEENRCLILVNDNSPSKMRADKFAEMVDGYAAINVEENFVPMPVRAARTAAANLATRELSQRNMPTIENVTKNHFPYGNANIPFGDGEFLGKGGFAHVTKNIDNRTNEFVAIKWFCDCNHPDTLQTIKREMNFYRDVGKHPNIIRYINLIRYNDYLLLVMEYMDGGSLDKLVRPKFQEFPLVTGELTEDRKRLDPGAIAYILRETLLGLEAIHKKNLVHSDLKGSNVLYSTKGAIKISDFGIAKKLTRTKQEVSNNFGDILFQAPETYKGGAYDKKADIWSFGVFAFELQFGLPPYASEKEPDNIRNMILHQDLLLPHSLSKDFKEIIGMCRHLNPKKRKSAKSLLKTTFIKTYNNKESFIRALKE